MPRRALYSRVTPLWAKFAGGKYPELRLLYHIPNEGKRTRATGGRIRAEETRVK